MMAAVVSASPARRARPWAAPVTTVARGCPGADRSSVWLLGVRGRHLLPFWQLTACYRSVMWMACSWFYGHRV